MKYPQLVSSRAVNAISDWLVSRLELLGVEAPLIYSRLLLSLLHSSVQINDPIEFNNLETYLSARKGNKRNPPCDTNTLKKLTAIQCLMETVSSEQEIAKIESLVDELCEKLSDIEKKINSNEEEHFQTIENILNSLAAGAASTSTTNVNINNNCAFSTSSSGAVSTTTLNSNCKLSSKRINSELEDLRKRYYNAFPALSKEMEDSFRMSNRNMKALTWPCAKSSLQINNSNINNKNELCSNTAGVKRKPKRRRNKAMSKGRSSLNIRKSSYSGNCSPTWDTDFEGSWEMGRDLIKEFIVKENNRNRSTSESAAYNNTKNHCKDLINICEKRRKPMEDNKMDADDDDYNENDLINLKIKSKPTQQVSAIQQSVLNFKLPNNPFGMAIEMDGITTIPDHDNEIKMPISSSNVMQDEITITSDMLKFQENRLTINSNIDSSGNLIAFSDDGYSTHETITSISEMDSNIIINNFPRRLYERDTSNDEDSITSMNLCSNIEQQQYDFAQFKAKFNSSVEALWKNNDNNNNNNNNINSENSNTGTNEEINSLPNMETNKNLEHFWTNYYNHHYDNVKLNNDDDDDDDDNDDANSNKDVAIKKEYETEFFSMPIIKTNCTVGDENINKINRNKETSRETNRLLMKVPSGVFLQDSIWSDSANNYDDDDSFYASVLKSSYKQDSKIHQGCPNEDKNQQNNYPINISKWSEGINGVTPLESVEFIPIQSSVTKPLSYDQTQQSKEINRNDLRENMLKNSYFYNNGQLNNNKTFYQPMSLQSETEYNKKSIASSSSEYYFESSYSEIDSQSNCDHQKQKQQQEVPITLVNHSVESGFIAYSKIKLQPSKFVMSDVVRKTINNINDTDSSSLYGVADIEEENLLTSDRTHFRPIKQSYADGYVFEISNNYDDVHYQRSPNGYLHLNGDKYLEYTRSDAITVDEESSGSLFNSGKLTKTSDGKKDNTRGFNNKKRKEFILKFRIKSSNEKFCQTDPSISGENSKYVLKITKGHRRYQLNQNSIKDYKEYDNDYDDDDDSSDDIESMDNNCHYTKFVANSNLTTVPSAPEFEDDYDYCTATGQSTGIATQTTKASIPFDELNQWSMFEIGKKCLDNHHSLNFSTSSSTNGNIPSRTETTNISNNNSHSLWGLCPTCNMIDAKISVPANRLLKDELKLEADEIMSDLKYMQDLYIGGGIGSDWEDDVEINDDNNDDTDFDVETFKDCDYYQPNENKFFDKILSNNNSRRNFDNYNKLSSPSAIIVDDQQKEMFYSVTKLITDFLKPENAKSLANALVGEAIYAAAVVDEHEQQQRFKNMGNCEIEEEVNNNYQTDKYCGSLWNTDEHNIWKQNEFIKPIMSLNNNTNYANNNNNNNNIVSKADLEEKLNWEFSNLADIWKKNSLSQPQQNQENQNSKICNKNQDEKLAISQHKNDNDSGRTEEDIKHIDIDKKTIEEQNERTSDNLNTNISEKNISQPHQQQQQQQSNSKITNQNNNILKVHQNRFDRKRRHSASQNVIVSTTTTTISDIINSNKIGYTNNNIIVGGGQFNFFNNNNNNNKNENENCELLTSTSTNFYDNIIIGNNQNIEILSAKEFLNCEKFQSDCIGVAVDNDYDGGNGVNENHDVNNISSGKSTGTATTIITCKYWTTTLDSSTLPNKTATFILDNKNNVGTAVTQWNKNFIADPLNGNGVGGGGGGGAGVISINPSSILKHVALIARPLTR